MPKIDKINVHMYIIIEKIWVGRCLCNHSFFSVFCMFFVLQNLILMNVSKAHRIIVTLKDITVSTHTEVTTVSVNQELCFVHKLVGFNHTVTCYG